MDIMDMLDKRLNDKGKNWRHVLKALKVLDYEGSERVVTWARQNMYIIKTLREFQYIDEEGRDVGQNGELPSDRVCIDYLRHLLTWAQSVSRQRSSQL